MPGTNGIDLLNELAPGMYSNMCVVFYTAFDRYMIDALRCSAFDFLLKPYRPEELQLIINRVEERLREGNRDFEQTVCRLLAGNRKFALYSITGLLLLKQTDILHLPEKPLTATILRIEPTSFLRSLKNTCGKRKIPRDRPKQRGIQS
jgi:two-component system LytT family response regulator